MLLIIQHCKLNFLKNYIKTIAFLIALTPMLSFAEEIFPNHNEFDQKIKLNYEKFESNAYKLAKKEKIIQNIDNDLSLHLKISDETENQLSNIISEWKKSGVKYNTSQKYFPGKIIVNDNLVVNVKLRLKGSMKDHTGCDKYPYIRGGGDATKLNYYCNIFLRSDKSSTIKKLDGPSFRIKISDKNITHINGMNEFNIQSSYRQSKNIFFIYDLMKKFGLTAPRVKSIKFSMNNVLFDNYHIIDRHTKNFQESNKLKESIIFYLAHNDFNQNSLNYFSVEQNKSKNTAGFRNKISQRIPLKYYKAKRISKKNDPLLNSYLKEGYALLWGYRSGILKFEQVFDKENVLKSILISDIICDPHALIRHINLKYYYNPYTRKIEFLLNDFVDINPLKNNNKGELYNMSSCENKMRGFKFLKEIYRDEYKNYAMELSKIISESDFNNLTIKDTRSNLSFYKKYLKYLPEKKIYQNDSSHNHYINFNIIKKRLDYYANDDKAIGIFHKFKNQKSEDSLYKFGFGYPKSIEIYNDSIYKNPINIYYIKHDDKNYDEIWLENTINHNVTINKLFFKSNKKFSNKLKYLSSYLEKLTIQPHNKFNGIRKIRVHEKLKLNYKTISKINFTVSYKTSKEFNKNKMIERLKKYKVEEIFEGDINRIDKNLVSVDVPLYYAPSAPLSISEIAPMGKVDNIHNHKYLKNFLKTHKYIILKNKEFIIENKNDLYVENDILVPSGYSLTIKDSMIKFSEGVRIILHNSPLKLQNSSLTAADQKKGWLGIIVNKSYNKKSIIKDSYIKNIKYIDGKIENSNWPLTGAVNFYKSNVDIISSNFISNKTEDMLNIISSKYEIHDTNFKDTMSDAFDSDFSNGIITNTKFDDIGNDAVDISGSKLLMKNSYVNGAKDKAISIGEASDFKGNNIKVKNSNIGIVSKDLSISEIINSNFSDINDSVYMCYQKKGEYGPGKILALNNSVKFYKSLFKLDKLSKIIIDEDETAGGKLNIEYLYGK